MGLGVVQEVKSFNGHCMPTSCTKSVKCLVVVCIHPVVVQHCDGFMY